jgi:hypothetical protein
MSRLQWFETEQLTHEEKLSGPTAESIFPCCDSSAFIFFSLAGPGLGTAGLLLSSTHVSKICASEPRRF